ncbi:hypothetical protein MMC13_001488 [Lambiella insularis]|nr:hypothetical protein [Lambiella insularis]
MADQVVSHTSSPGSPSSGGAESHRCTPGTKLTDFSPEDTRQKAKPSLHGGVQINLPPAFALHGVPVNSGPNGKASGSSGASGAIDPFTVTPSALRVNGTPTTGIKLSPTAASFSPQQSCTTATNTKLPEPASGTVAIWTSGPADIFATSAVSYLNATSVPDYGPPYFKSAQNSLSIPGRNTLSPIGPPVAGHGSSSSFIGGSQSLDQSVQKPMDSTRCLKILVPRDTSVEMLNSTFTNLPSPVPKIIIISEMPSEGIVYVRYADLRNSKQAYDALVRTQPSWLVQYVGIQQLMAYHKPELDGRISEFEGQIKVTASYHVNRSPLNQNPGVIVVLVREMLENFGDLISFDVCDVSFPTLSIIVGYYDVDAADRAVAHLNGFNVSHVSLAIVCHTPDLGVVPESSTTKNRGPLIMDSGDHDLDQNFRSLNISGNHERSGHKAQGSKHTWSSGDPSSGNASGAFGGHVHGYPTSASSTLMYDPQNFNNHQPSSFPYGYPSVGAHNFDWQTHARGTLGQVGMVPLTPRARVSPLSQRQHGLNKGMLRQNNEYGSGHHNVVDIERIRQGLDVRTTIMLRNIPNKVDQALLKEIVDETSSGKYDFMYLRIDFANNCNVGYAFINFEDPYYIIDFVRARAGHRWNRFNSDKVAEVSYATIQGKDCLVQKFRNSSVMLEHPGSRPKIFYTGTDYRAGQEEKFPGPDNPSKMRRSVENAEHVGRSRGHSSAYNQHTITRNEGLFAPRAGQHFRDEQRRRRSQYDRGTRLAEIEDSYAYDGYYSHALLPHQYQGPNNRAYHGSQGAYARGY